MSTLQVEDLAIERGSAVLADDLNFVVSPDQVLAVVGPNGCGKTTLLETIAGQWEPAGGQVTFSPVGAVGLMTQSRQFPPGQSLRSAVAQATGVAAAADDLGATTARVESGDLSAETSAGYDRALHTWLARGGADFSDRLLDSLAEVGLNVNSHVPMHGLSRGQLARVQLVSILMSRFDVLLLDEPTNDLDQRGLELLATYVETTAAPVVVVSHDRRFLANVATSVLEFDPALEETHLYTGGYESWLKERQHRHLTAQESHDQQEARRTELRQQADSARRRAAKGVTSANRKYQSGQVDKLQLGAMREGATAGGGSAKRLQKDADKIQPAREPRKQWQLQLSFPYRTGGTGSLTELRDANVLRGDYLLGPFNLRIFPQDRILLSGPNGAGKSSLLQLFLGDLPPDHGEALPPKSSDLGYLDQARSLPTEVSLLTWAKAQLANQPGEEIRTLLAKFGLGADDISKRVDELSWGERTRAILATLAARETRIIVLDEPTNHLDLAAVEQVESALADYPGAILLITHDEQLRESFRRTRQWQINRSYSGAMFFQEEGA